MHHKTTNGEEMNKKTYKFELIEKLYFNFLIFHRNQRPQKA